jgi:hypothetical protein
VVGAGLSRGCQLQPRTEGFRAQEEQALMRSITYDLLRLQMTDDEQFLHLRQRQGAKVLAIDFVEPAVARKGTDHDSTLVTSSAREGKKSRQGRLDHLSHGQNELGGYYCLARLLRTSCQKKRCSLELKLNYVTLIASYFYGNR